jgi:TolB-like protein
MYVSLAVLPLENLSHDQSQDYFSDGMTDELILPLLLPLPHVFVLAHEAKDLPTRSPKVEMFLIPDLDFLATKAQNLLL